MSKSTRFVRRRGAVVVALALAMLAASAAASARPAETSPGGCAPSLSQPFMRWLDPGS